MTNESPELFNRHGDAVDASTVVEFNAKRGSGKYRSTRACSRCGGAGGSSKWEYTGWTCFQCGGQKRFSSVERCYTKERISALNAAAAARAEKLCAVRAARHAQVEFDAARYAADRVALLAEIAAADAARFDSWRAQNEPAIAAIALVETRQSADVAARIMGRHTVSDRTIDVALSVAVQRLAECDARASSQFVGTIGERVVLELTCEKVLDFSFGSFPRIYSYLQIFRDTSGNRVVYKGSTILADPGETIRVKATVAEHEIYRDERQTRIKRPKVLDVVAQ